ncbi:MAG: lysophospholipid acyltransferase family protein [Elusimicrobiota bacterium]
MDRPPTVKVKEDWASHSLQYRVATSLARFFATVLHRGVLVEGLENLPRSGRVILASNHSSVLDPPIIGMSVSRLRFPHYLAKRELLRPEPFGMILRSWGTIPVDRGRGDTGAIRAVLRLLESEGCMVIFPEGTRQKPGRVSRAKPGVGYLAKASGAPVVPLRVRNTELLFGMDPFRVTLGRSMMFGGDGERESYQEFADRVLQAIYAL